MSAESYQPPQEQPKVPGPGKKARLLTALLTTFGLSSVHIDKPNTLDSQPPKTTPLVQKDTREPASLGGLTVTSTSTDSERTFDLNPELILKPTILLEATEAGELGLDISSILQGIQDKTLSVSIIPVTEGSGMVIFGVEPSGSADPNASFSLVGHAYAQHEDHFTYDLAREYELGENFVITVIQPTDVSTGKTDSTQRATTIVRSGELELPPGCDGPGWPKSCSQAAAHDWIQHELTELEVGVQYLPGQ